MKKVYKLICVLLAVLICSTSVVFGADSKTTTPKITGKQYGEYTGYSKTGKATFTGVVKSKRAKLKFKIIRANFTKGGKKYVVNKIAKNAFKGCKKVKVIKYKGGEVLKIAKGAFSGINTKKVTFKCFKKKISAAKFKKLKKALKKAGFKGKIVRK